jgi:1-acyl-sn-glycerol-3-phosphate acyltransferase
MMNCSFTYDLLVEREQNIEMSGITDIDNEYQERRDESHTTWALTRAILLSPLAITRAFIVFSTIFLAAAASTLLLNGRKYSNLNGFIRRLFDFIFYIGTRISVFILGIHWIEYVYISDEEMKKMQDTVRNRVHSPLPTSNSSEPDKKLDAKLVNDHTIDPYLIVSNHVTSFDSFILKHCMGTITAVAKDDVKESAIGTIAKNMDCLFVDKNNKKQIVEEMFNRTKHYYEHLQKNVRSINDPRPPRLIIYPEGTTSSGHQMLRFQTGACRSGAPIQPVVLRFPYKFFNCGWTGNIAPWKYFLLQWTQFNVKLTVFIFPKYIPNEEERNNSMFYAENLRRVMCCGANLHCDKEGDFKMKLSPALFNRFYKKPTEVVEQDSNKIKND